MKTLLLAISALTLLSGCVVEDLNSALTSTTYSIYENVDAVQRSNAAVAHNCCLVNESNRVVEENRRLIEAAH